MKALSEQSACTAYAESTKRTARLFRALGQPVRLAIVRALTQESRMCAHVLATQCHLRQFVVQRHLRTLQRLGVVHASKRGDCTLYALDPEIMQLLAAWPTEPPVSHDAATS